MKSLFFLISFTRFHHALRLRCKKLAIQFYALCFITCRYSFSILKARNEISQFSKELSVAFQSLTIWNSLAGFALKVVGYHPIKMSEIKKRICY